MSRIELVLDDDQMTSNVTRHTASRTADGWAVSWLPGRILDRNQAITAMTIAQTVAMPEAAGGNAELLVDSLAGELDLTGDKAREAAL